MTASEAIQSFINLAITNETITEEDSLYLRNRLLHFLGVEDWEVPLTLTMDSLVLLDALEEIARITGKLVKGEEDFFESELMNFLTPLPGQINQKFWEIYKKSPKKATDYFYQLSKNTNNIQTRAIARNIEYKYASKYGDIEITINLSKPEKDPKLIAEMKTLQGNNYPKCQLCMENEGYYGRKGYPARSNHRIIRLELNGEKWGFQYSPYAYYNEHSILLNETHQPMKIDKRCFQNLFTFIEKFPHYMIGSNADLPIVGGSILTHDHYQAGCHEFPMEKAGIRQSFLLAKFPQIKAGIVNWPMSVIRLRCKEAKPLVEASNFILKEWQSYNDEQALVRALDDEGVQHHTITPIARQRNEQYEIDLVLRDNNVSDDYPDGIFHPHRDIQHIKRENIGLIEVMGLAILPPRLENELKEVEKYCLGQTNEIKEMHLAWADKMKAKNTFTSDNAQKVIREGVGEIFVRVLQDAGVFKDNLKGHQAFGSFIERLNMIK